MSSLPGVSVSVADRVGHLVLDKAPVNAFDDAFLSAIAEAVREATGAVDALVVSSAVPRIFAAGGDIPWMASAPIEAQLRFVDRCQRTYSLFEEAPFPTIAAIEGACLGGGLELALACDLRVVGDGAVLGAPETRIGLIAGAGGITRLTRLVGRSLAHDLLMTGRRLSATEAATHGIVTRSTPAGGALDAALALARQLAGGAVEAIAATKRLAVVAGEGTIAEALARERAAWEVVRGSARTQEGLDAFAQHRAPDFGAAAARAQPVADA